ncbi:MAG: hypothetical protein IBGAMO2_580005 [Arenicellales bacterium IbO2]|nr:hypothetical protein [Gammaproteobacteria bacterium]MDA8022999.1 hypothetical protein [Gammaproteobacteria bacterium]CAJ2377108.1 MAG: hypothetical protein IBGAMO2_580005 [Arenicellales bacterium IbO2]
MKIAVGSLAWYELPFSRRVELSRIAPADMPKLSDEYRQNLLAAIRPSLSRATASFEGIWGVRFRKTVDGEFWGRFLVDFVVGIRSYSLRSIERFFEKWLGAIDWDESERQLAALETLESMFRTPGMPNKLAMEIENALDGSPYHIDRSVTPISVEMTEQHANTKAAQRAIRLARNAGMTEAANHLQMSEKKISTGDYRSSMEECAFALESIVHVIDPSNEKQALGKCLQSPVVQSTLKHRALRSALGKIYNYLSQVVRHAKGNEKPDVNREIALFIYDVSAAFAEYLVSAHRKSKKPRKKKKK